MYQSILVPIDDSHTSRQALQEAVRFVKDQHARLRLVNVIDLAQFSWGGAEFVDVGQLQQGLRENAGKLLDEVKSQLAAQGVEAQTAVVEVWGGPFYQGILDEAKRWPADIIVMGTHGWTGLDHLLMGSVAEGVVRHSSLPVLLIRAGKA